jgi:DnaJ-class molecular chaperone
MAELIGMGLIYIGGHTLSLYLWPFRKCRRCKGTGRNPGSSSSRWGQCRRCRGAGYRRRLGAKTIHHGAVSLQERAARRKQGGK